MDLSRVGPFALEERLPGAEHTYRAVHVVKRKTVALKVIPLPLGGNPHAVAEFIAECEDLQRLRHANIVKSYGGGVEEPFAYLASAVTPGESFARLMRKGPIPWQLVVEY